jgi:hypothetical protein
VLGDDDGFLPSTLDVVRNLLTTTNARLVAWDCSAYWWPDTIVHWHRNRLYVPLGNNDLGWMDSRAALIESYRNVAGFGGDLPMIYNGFVHRDVINTVIDRFGGYFVPAELSPDITSGIINLTYTSRFLYSRRPLAVRGNSRRSTGTAFWARSLGEEQQNVYLKEQGRTAAQLMHPTMTTSLNIGFGVASTKLSLKDLLFPHDNEIRVDLGATLKHVVASLNDDPEAYDDNLTEALQLAEKIGYAIDPRSIPAKGATTPVWKPLQGPCGAGPALVIGINCNLANVFDVAGAARLAESISSPVTARITPTAAIAEPETKAS